MTIVAPIAKEADADRPAGRQGIVKTRLTTRLTTGVTYINDSRIIVPLPPGTFS
jgi:hypothetical protein